MPALHPQIIHSAWRLFRVVLLCAVVNALVSSHHGSPGSLVQHRRCCDVRLSLIRTREQRLLQQFKSNIHDESRNPNVRCRSTFWRGKFSRSGGLTLPSKSRIQDRTWVSAGTISGFGENVDGLSSQDSKNLLESESTELHESAEAGGGGQSDEQLDAKDGELLIANQELQNRTSVQERRQDVKHDGNAATADIIPTDAGDGSAQMDAENSGDDGDEFGAHGWYSPPEVDSHGSLFSWKEEEERRRGRQSTSIQVVGQVASQEESGQGRRQGRQRGDSKSDSEKVPMTDATGEDGSRSSESQVTGRREESEEWSHRRKLLENWQDYDEVWISMREEAKEAAEKEPLLVSFVYSTILNQKSLEDAVAFHLANKLAGPNMLSTQVQALVTDCFREVGYRFRRQLRRDMIAVRERDPACESYHDCLLYFKGFQALETHRVAHWLYHSGRHALAFYLQSQVNQEFQIDIHPAATFGEGVFIDHGTGIVVGETAVVGDDVSMLHRVTLGGSGVQTQERHPKIGNGVLLGAGACLLGNISVGKGTQIGAGSLVVEDLPESCVAVGVPARVIGQGKKSKPALVMDQDCFKGVWKGSDI